MDFETLQNIMEDASIFVNSPCPLEQEEAEADIWNFPCIASVYIFGFLMRWNEGQARLKGIHIITLHQGAIVQWKDGNFGRILKNC
jgi:hypothetical protein